MSTEKDMETDANKEENLEEKSQDGNEDKKDTAENTELEKYWKAVKDNPSDFTGWTYLLQYVEQENKIEAAREAYDAFFSHYPYCYGYWKKYADMEKRQGNLEKATEVFEEGVKAISLSIELWLHYINFYVAEFGSTEQGENDIRKLYEKAIRTAGNDFRSDKLWDAYISWEKDLVRITALYERVLAIPTQLYSHHFDNFKHHVFIHHPKEILDLDDFLKLRKDIVARSAGVGDEDDDTGTGGTAPPGEDVPPGMETEGGKSDEDEAMKLRDRIIEIQETAFKKTEEEVSKRWNFEESKIIGGYSSRVWGLSVHSACPDDKLRASYHTKSRFGLMVTLMDEKNPVNFGHCLPQIKRPYFHVKPLERSQLKNWREYLDYEMQQGNHDRVVTLFERCMIACALYEDFWMKYAKYMEDHSIEAVRNVYTRACKIHLPKKPYIHMAWAAFEERQGNHSAAWEILSRLEKDVPGLVMVSMRRISLERRTGNLSDAEALFQEYIENATQPEISSFFSIKYARYVFKIQNDQEKARKVLSEAIEKDKGNLKLYLQLLDLEYQSHPVSEERVSDLFGMILGCENFPLETKVKMSQRKLEFLEDFGGNICKLKESYDEHQKLMKELHTERKKRTHEPPGHTHHGEPPEKRAKPSESAQNGAGDQQSSQTADNSHANYPYHWGAYSNSGYYPQQHWGSYSSHYYPS